MNPAKRATPRPPRSAALLTAALVTAALLAGLPAAAGIADDLSLSGSAELDQDGGWRLSAALRGDIGAETRWNLGVSRSELEDDLSGLTTTGARAGLTRRFGPLAVDLALRWWEDSDIVQARIVGGGLTWEGDAAYAGVSVERRRSDFDPFRVATLIQLPNRDPIAVTATADCDLDDTGIGANAGWFAGGWYAALDAMSYDYDRAECGFDSPVIETLRNADRRVFVQLAGRVAARLSNTAGLRLQADNAFLDYRAGVQGGLERLERGYYLRYERAEERFLGLQSQTITLGMNFYRESGHSFGIYAGVSDGDAFDTVAFIGVDGRLSLR